MKKISIVVQGDGAISNRQRVVVNPERFRSVPELVQVLSMELKQADGAPLILPASTTISILQPTGGMFVPLVDVRHVEDASRLQISASGAGGGGRAATADGFKRSVLRGGEGADGLSRRGGGGGSSTDSNAQQQGLVIEKGTDLYDVLMYHCKIVAYLSANLPMDKEITVQDIQAVSDDPQSKTRQLMDQLVGSKVDAVSSAKILTQLALQRGKSDREQNDGSNTVKMRQTLSAYQNRIDRLEAELEKATVLYEATQTRLDAVFIEREKTTSGLSAVIASNNSDALVKVEEGSFLRTCASNFQRDMSDMLVTPAAGQHFTLSGNPQDVAAKIAASPSKKKGAHSEMPSSLNEEKYLRIVDPDRPARQNLQLANIMQHIERLQVERPSTTGMLQQRPVLGDAASASSSPLAGGGPSEICVVCNLLLLSGASRMEPLFMSRVNPAFPKFVEQFLTAFASDIEANGDNRSVFEFSFFRNGTRSTIKTSQELSAFLNGGRPSHDGRPRSVALNCLELKPALALDVLSSVTTTVPDLTKKSSFDGKPAGKFFGTSAATKTAEGGNDHLGGSGACGTQQRPKTTDALSTRSFFLSVGPTPVPTDSAIRDIFASLQEDRWISSSVAQSAQQSRASPLAGSSVGSAPKMRVAHYLESKYETYGDRMRFQRIIDQASPTDSLTLDQFSMVLLRVIRE